MLSFKNINVSFGKRQVLRDVDFSLTPHTFTAVVGKNGSGKSTLVSCVNQTVRYTGEVLLGEKNIALIPDRERAQTVAVLPQILTSPHMTVRELAQLGRNPYVSLARRLSQTDEAEIESAIERAEVSCFADQAVDAISGGERQRAYLAMILAQNTRAIVLDEPTTHLDMQSEYDFLDMLSDLKTTKKKTLLVVLHDLTAAIKFADRLAVLDVGKLVFYGSREECLAQCVLETTFGVSRYTVGNNIFFSPNSDSTVMTRPIATTE